MAHACDLLFWLHIAMCCALVGGFAGIACSLCALVGGFAGIACSLSLQPCTVPSCVNWLVAMQEAMLMCIYVAASSSHCYLLVGSSASNSAPALFPTHPLLEDLTGCLLSCAACMCQHVGCTLPTDRQWIRWQVFICRYNIGQYWDNNLEWNAINCDWHTGRSMPCVPAQVCMLPFPSYAGRVGWLMHGASV